MRFGIRLHRLWQLRLGVIVSFLLALVAATWSVAEIHLAPLGLTSRVQPSASASVNVIVDTPESSMIDLRQDTGSISVLRTRSVLIGTVVASAAVRSAIARRAGVPLETLEVTPPASTPLTGGDGSKVERDGSQRLVQPNSITIRTSETVPLMEIFTRAQTTRTAELLADAAVEETRSYLSRLSGQQRTPATSRIRLVGLGRAEGSVLDEGIGLKTPILVFVFVFGIACASLVSVARLRSDLRQAALAERPTHD